MDDPKKILVIDDEPNIIEVLTLRLTKAGFEVESALDGVTGITKAIQCKPKAVLLDVSMPDMDGWEVCKRLRADPKTKDLKIFILTGTRQLQQAKECKADQVILKPFNFEEILDLLGKVN